MSNIVGEPFNKYVTGQILARQLIYGKEQRDSQKTEFFFCSHDESLKKAAKAMGFPVIG